MLNPHFKYLQFVLLNQQLLKYFQSNKVVTLYQINNCFIHFCTFEVQSDGNNLYSRDAKIINIFLKTTYLFIFNLICFEVMECFRCLILFVQFLSQNVVFIQPLLLLVKYRKDKSINIEIKIFTFIVCVTVSNV